MDEWMNEWMNERMWMNEWMVQVIAAEGEQKASRALKDASDVMAESSAALQLRYLQVL